MQLLSIENTTVRYGNSIAVEDVSLHLEEQQIVTVIGPNGAGKSSLLNATVGMIPSTGRYVYMENDITSTELEARVTKGLCLVPERRELFTTMSVKDNLLLGSYSRRQGAVGRKKSLSDVYYRFPVLKDKERKSAGTLSGGERQMLAIGRALMANPRVLMLDEPSLGLAPLITEQIFHIISELKEAGVSILLVEQNARAALNIADFGYVLEAGHIKYSGPAGKLINDPHLVSIYFGG